MLNPLDVFRAMAMILSREPRDRMDALLLHAKTRDDDEGLFEVVDDLHRTWRAPVIINGSAGETAPGGAPGEAWAGVKEYHERLISIDVCPDNIFHSEPAFNCRQENDNFLALAVKYNWTQLVIVNQPHHMLRTILGAVKVISNRGLSVVLHCVAPQWTDWTKDVAGSHSVSRATRFDHCEAELGRIERYQAQGDLATFSELFNYLTANP